MDLTREQRAMLAGERGPVVAKCMSWLVAWGEAMRARRLVPVENVMPSGPTVPGRMMSAADADSVEQYVAEWRERWSTPVRPYTVTSHVARFDLDQAELMEVRPRYVELQREIVKAATLGGTLATWTCTPYLVGNVPVKGQVCAWTESHAVVFINSILGARTTRHGAESAIAAALTGYTPEFGPLLDEGRRGDFVVEVRTPLRQVADWGALGYFAAQRAGLRAPVFTGLPSPTIEAAKQLCAALATAGGVAMFHIVGVTPEAPSLEAACQGPAPSERYVFGERELKEVYESLRRISGDEVDFVYVGCPHCTLSEFAEVVRLMGERRVADGVLFLVTMPYALKMNAQRLGLLAAAERAGIRVMSDTCPAVAEFPVKRRMVTNSVKQAHYLRAILKNESILASVGDCVEAAIRGRWV
jgi:predicted aconitase